MVLLNDRPVHTDHVRKPAPGDDRRRTGIGKTTLAMEMGRRAAERGAVVLQGRCDEHLVAPYLPFINALTDALRSLDHHELMVLIGPRERDVVEIIPGLAPDPKPSTGARPVEGGLSMVEWFATLEWLLDRVRDSAPLVLLLDDLQWADSTSVGLHGYLTFGSRLPKTLILDTYRSTELEQESRLADLLVRLRSNPNSERVSVGGLSRDAIERLVGHPGHDEAYTDWIQSETGGNPLFIGELVRHGEINGRSTGVPEGILEVLSQRIRRLSVRTQTFLERAAVLGDDLPVALLRATNTDLDDLSEAIGEAVRGAIVGANVEAVQWFDRAIALLGPDDPLRRSLRLTRFVAAQSAWRGHFDESSIRRKSVSGQVESAGSRQ